MVAGQKKYRNVREDPPGSNRGAMVLKFLKHVGFGPATWCCAMHWYVADVVAHYNGPKQSGSRAYVPHLEEWAQKVDIIVPLRKSRAGMTVTYCWGRGAPGRQGRPRRRAPGGGNEQDRVRISVHRVDQINSVIDLARLQEA